MENLGNSTSLATDAGDFVPLVPYNGTSPTGGDSLMVDLNVYYQVSPVCNPSAANTNNELVWRHCMDYHVNYFGLVDDSWRWV